jgi:hypothetical protein
LTHFDFGWHSPVGRATEEEREAKRVEKENDGLGSAVSL